MANIASGAGAGELLTIDPTSKAARVTLYDSSGNEAASAPTGSYMLAATVVQSTTTAANSAVFTMRAGATRACFIRRIFGTMGSDVTTATAVVQRYHLIRFTAASPSGGTALTPAKKNSANPASNVADARFLDTGLTVTGITFESSNLGMIGTANANSSPVFFEFNFDVTGQKHSDLVLNVNEGLAIRLENAAVAGEFIIVNVEWDER